MAMKNLKMKWALIVALAIPGMALNSCWSVFLAEVRDAAIAGVGDYTQDTASSLLDNYINLDGTTQ